MWYAWERREKCKKVLVRKPEGKRPSEKQEAWTRGWYQNES